MKTFGKDRRSWLRRAVCMLAAGVLCLAAGFSAAESPQTEKDPDLILAQDAAARMSLQDPEGTPVTVRRAPSLPGRGETGEDGGLPDYVGVVGFASLPKDSEIDKYYILEKAYWTVPVFQRTGSGFVKDGNIPHKLPVLVTGQDLKQRGKNTYSGWLEIVRLDTGEACTMDVRCFVTRPYWSLPVSEVPAYGYSIAVYRESPGKMPRDEEGNACTLRDGTKVLLPFAGAYPDRSPDPEDLTVQGILFGKDEEGNTVPRIVYFRESDLRVSY